MRIASRSRLDWFRPGRTEGARRARGRRAAAGVERLEGRAMLAAAVTVFPPPPSGTPGTLLAGPDGNLWFTVAAFSPLFEATTFGGIGRVTPSGAVSEYALPSGGAPAGLIVGPDGDLWFTVTGANAPTGTPASFIGRVTPSGAVSEFPVPSNGTLSGPIVGPDGDLWFTEFSFSGPPSGFIGRVTTSGAVSEFPLPLGIAPAGLIVGPDGDLWFTGGFVNLGPGPPSSLIGRVTTSGAVSEFPIPSGSFPSGLTVGPDGDLWFAATLSGNVTGGSPSGFIGRVSTSGAVSEYPLPSGYPGYGGLTVGPDGSLWFTALVNVPSNGLPSGLIGRVTTSGAVSEYALPSGGYPSVPIVGPDGNLWFTEEVEGSSGGPPAGLVGRVTPAGVVSEFPIPSGGFPGGLVDGPDGDLWFTTTESGLSNGQTSLFVGRASTSGAITESPVNGPSTANSLGLLTLGPDGNLWTAEYEQDFPDEPSVGLAIVRANVADFPVPQSPSPTVTGLHRTGVHRQPTRLVLSFDAALSPTSAHDPAHYAVVPAGPRGRVRPHARTVPIRTAAYDATADTVTLTPARRLDLHGYYRVTVRGTLLGADGAPLAGTGRGQPGSDYVALLHGFGTVAPAPAPREVRSAVAAHPGTIAREVVVRPTTHGRDARPR